MQPTLETQFAVGNINYADHFAVPHATTRPSSFVNPLPLELDLQFAIVCLRKMTAVGKSFLNKTA